MAAGGTWGPDAIPYLNGVVCTSSNVSSALVSWTGSDGGTAFGLQPIQSGSGQTDEPATNGVAVPVSPDANGLGASTIAQLAFLISRHGSDAAAGTVADVAAGVVQLAGTSTSGINPSGVAACLARDAGGSSAGATAALLTEAGRLAGPYTVSVTGPSTATKPGTAIPLVAHVTSAAGAPVPGLPVTFSPSGSGVQLSANSGTTGARGDVTITAQVPDGKAASATAAGASVAATVAAPVGLLETTTSGDVPLIESAAPSEYTGTVVLALDSRPDPRLRLTSTEPLLLTNGQLAQTLTVTGMNGHTGAATVTLYGPLALPSGGCGGYHATQWAAARAAQKIAEAPQLTVPGDGALPVHDADQLAPGCYQPVARLVTTDATPNVTATVTGGPVTVAPVTVAASPGHGGIAPAGALHTTLDATSTFATSWSNVQGTVLGPRVASSGQCPTDGWAGVASRATIVSVDASNGSPTGSSAPSSSSSALPTDTSPTDSSPTDTLSSGDLPADDLPTGDLSSGAPSGSGATTAAVAATSSAVTAAGCYAFALTGTLTVAGLGSVAVTVSPGTQSAPVQVITPSVTVDQFSRSGIDSGGHLSATVTVSQSDGQPGSLRLQLVRLPYTYRGCFGADWQRGEDVESGARTPVVPTTGDDTYTVPTAAVPGTACWTVVPVFAATANPAVRATASAGADPMLAFTSTVAPAATDLESAAVRSPSSTGREIGVAIGAGVLLLVVLVATVAVARRGRGQPTNRSAAVP